MRSSIVRWRRRGHFLHHPFDIKAFAAHALIEVKEAKSDRADRAYESGGHKSDAQAKHLCDKSMDPPEAQGQDRNRPLDHSDDDVKSKQQQEEKKDAYLPACKKLRASPECRAGPK